MDEFWAKLGQEGEISTIKITKWYLKLMMDGHIDPNMAFI